MVDPFTNASASYQDAKRHLFVSGPGFSVGAERWTLVRFVRVMAPALLALIALVAWRLL